MQRRQNQRLRRLLQENLHVSPRLRDGRREFQHALLTGLSKDNASNLILGEANPMETLIPRRGYRPALDDPKDGKDYIRHDQDYQCRL